MRLSTFARLALGIAATLTTLTGFAQTQPTPSTAARPVPAPPPTNGMTAKPDSQMQAVLDRLAALKPLPLETLSAGEARYQPAFPDALKNYLQIKQNGAFPQPEAVARIEDRAIPGAAGLIPIRIYTPAGATAGQPLPVVVYYHGGGWAIASINAYDASARGLANAARAIVVAVEYRKAPENKFPGAHEDSFTAYQWTLANAQSIGGDPKKIAVAGESAGGNLACNMSILARDRKIQLPVYQVLVYPIANNDLDSPSMRENTSQMIPLNRAKVAWFVDKYFDNPAQAADPRIALVKADLRGLPATTIVLAQIDPLRSEGELLIDRLRAAGIRVDQRTYDGVTHEFFGMSAAVDKAKQAMQQAAAGLRSGFGK